MLHIIISKNKQPYFRFEKIQSMVAKLQNSVRKTTQEIYLTKWIHAPMRVKLIKIMWNVKLTRI